jgi:diguanylate cyclase (GGDEF)-like protein
MEFNFQGALVKMTASIGVADIADLKVVDAENLIKAADVALYEAKRTGRNRAVLFEEGLLGEPLEPPH